MRKAKKDKGYADRNPTGYKVRLVVYCPALVIPLESSGGISFHMLWEHINQPRSALRQ